MRIFLIAGKAGSGKNVIIEQVAKALNLQFYYTKYHSFSKPLLVKNTKSIFKILKMLLILI